MCGNSDDNCAADALGSELLRRYYLRYREIAARIGVSLAGEENKSKAFGPSTEGEVLGLDYDTMRWKCWIPQDKSARLIRELTEILEKGEASNGEWMKVSGKLNHYHPLLLNGKFNRALISHAVKQEKKQDVMIALEPETKLQVYWWVLNLRALRQRGGRIMDPMSHLPARALDLHGDAAGGDTNDKRKGWGVCCLRTGEWNRESWPKFILDNKMVRGIQYGRKLTLLEGFTSLQAAYTWARQGQEQGGISLNCDNIGFYWAFRNGSSRDELVYTISKAINDLADGLGIVIRVFYQRRRTELGDQIVDHLSKGESQQVESLWPEGVRWTGRPSNELRRWIEKPRVMLDLGRRLLVELSETLDVHIGRNYREDIRRRESQRGAKRARLE